MSALANPDPRVDVPASAVLRGARGECVMLSKISGQEALDVLMVEDEPGDVFLMQCSLNGQARTFNLHVLDNGQAAIDYLNRRGPYSGAQRPDLILLDLNLPNKDGRQVLREVKADPALRSIPVIVLTTSEADEDVRAAYSCGASCFIHKPLQLHEFDNIARLIDQFWIRLVTYPSKAQPPS